MAANYWVLEKDGMQLVDIKRFIDMAMKGDESIDERLALILKQKQLSNNR